MPLPHTSASATLTEVPASIVCHPHQFEALLPGGWTACSPARKVAWLSLWSQWFFADALINWADQLCSEQRACPLWEFNGQLTLNTACCPERWHQRGEPLRGLTPAQQHQQTEQLICQFITPVCQTLSSLAGNNLTVFWSNAAVRLWQGMQQADSKAADVRIFRDLFSASHFTDGSINRLKAPLRTLKTPDGEDKTERRHCCLIFRLDDHQKCASCPLEKCGKH